MDQDDVILVIGGDERYIHTINYLAAREFAVYTIGYKEDTFSDPHITKTSVNECPFERATHIVLPVQGMSSNFEIYCELTRETILLTNELLRATKNECSFFTGTANTTLINLMKEHDRKLIVILERDDVAIYNSIPTAEGILQIAFEKTKQTVHGANVFVTGFGRIGMTIASLFHRVGAEVTVVVRKNADVARAMEMGLNTCYYSELHHAINNADIAVNTVPALVFSEDIISNMKQDMLYIDAASKPGGADFIALHKHKILSLHALGLPGKVAPKTAGEIIANVILE